MTYTPKFTRYSQYVQGSEYRPVLVYPVKPEEFPTYEEYLAAREVERANCERLCKVEQRAAALPFRKVRDSRPAYHKWEPGFGTVSIPVGDSELDLEIEVSVSGDFQGSTGNGWDEPAEGPYYESVEAWVYRHGAWTRMELNETQREIVEDFAAEHAQRYEREYAQGY